MRPAICPAPLQRSTQTLRIGLVGSRLAAHLHVAASSCRLNPVNLLDTCNPDAAQFGDVYTVEKIGTREGWSRLSTY